MRLSHVLTVALAVTAVPAAALACDGHKDASAKNAVKKLTLQDAVALQQQKKATFVDANSTQTRAKFGVVPGAVLLTSSKDFKAEELPSAKDAKLVFYCANTKCSAAPKAAARAAEIGYTDVGYLADGIMGWKDAGNPVATPQS